MSSVSVHSVHRSPVEKVKIHQRARTSWYPEASIKRVKSPRDLATQEARASVTRVGTPAALDYSDTLMNRGTISTGVLSRGLNIGPPGRGRYISPRFSHTNSRNPSMCACTCVREDVTTMSTVLGPCSWAVGRRMAQKNPINCFYGDKFPPGGARFLSVSLLSRSPPEVAPLLGQDSPLQRPYRSSMLIFSLIRYTRKWHRGLLPRRRGTRQANARWKCRGGSDISINVYLLPRAWEGTRWRVCFSSLRRGKKWLQVQGKIRGSRVGCRLTLTFDRRNRDGWS